MQQRVLTKPHLHAQFDSGALHLSYEFERVCVFACKNNLQPKRCFFCEAPYLKKSLSTLIFPCFLPNET